MHRTGLVSLALAAALLVASSTARADEPSAPASAPAAAPADGAPDDDGDDPAEPEDAPSTAAAPEGAPVDGASLRAFRARRLVYDPRTGGAYEGNEALDARQLYARLGRPDLVAKVDALDRRRSLFLWTGGAAIVAGVAGLVVAYATGPDLNAGRCVRGVEAYNACVSEHQTHQVAGMVAAGVGGLLGTTFLVMGLEGTASPVAHGEAASLVQRHNGALLRGLRPDAAAPRPGASLRVVPQVGVTGGGVSALLTF